MKKKLLIIFIAFNFNLFSQENPIKIEQLETLEQSIYEKLDPYKLIMLGEMHGTNEPANFLVGLAELFVRNGDTIQIGFEIPNELMSQYNQLLTEKNVFQSDFFTEESNDGRATVAWANAIAKLTVMPNVKVFFYDISQTEENTQHRDSLMYLNIKEKIISNPNWRTITLSGNIHNMLTKYRGKSTAAYYLINDNELNLSNAMCTFSHHYLRGTMLNNVGDGLELREVENKPSYFSEIVEFDNYLFFFPQANAYNGLLYTTIVTASELIDK